MVAGFDFLVDVQDLAVFADVVGPTAGHAARVQYAQLFGETFFGVTQDWIIQIQFFGELGVLFDRVDTCGEVGDVKRAKDLATLTE